jgi:TMEM175 potassium channel family protein
VNERPIRGFDLERTIAFSDGVFAVAITLLVLTLEVPRDIAPGELAHWVGDQGQQFLAFAISFAVVGLFWLEHHQLFGDLLRMDGRLVTMNLVYLGFVTLTPFTSNLFGDYPGEEVSTIMYAGALGIVGSLDALMRWYAAREGLLTEARCHAAFEWEIRESLIAPAVFFASAVIAVFSPTAASLTWLLLLARTVGVGIRRRRAGAAG